MKRLSLYPYYTGIFSRRRVFLEEIYKFCSFCSDSKNHNKKKFVCLFVCMYVCLYVWSQNLVRSIKWKRLELQTWKWCQIVDNLEEPRPLFLKIFRKNAFSPPPQDGVSNVFTRVKLLKYWFYRNFYKWLKCSEW